MQNNHLLKKAILTLLLCAAMPILNAQVAHIGDILCEGDLIVSPANFNANTHTAKAVVFYVDNTGQHGWAIALQDAGSFPWGGFSHDTPLPNYGNNRQAIYDLDGHENTRILLYEDNYTHAAFNAVDFEHGWYVPTIGQFNYLYGNLNEVNTSLGMVGGSPFVGSWYYWSSTEYSSDDAWILSNSGNLEHHYGNWGYSQYYAKSADQLVRAAINF